MKFPPAEDDTCHSVDMVDLSILDHIQEILPSDPFDSFLFELVIHQLPNKIISLCDENEDSKNDHDSSLCKEEPEDHINLTLFAATLFEEEITTPKLKDLPSHLEYA
ncbi:hypothetical protein Tco_0467353, partial [Tanacetum coccineum]